MAKNLDRKGTTIYSIDNARIGLRQSTETLAPWRDAIFCAMCSAPNVPDAQFCNRCGSSLLDQQSGLINVQAAGLDKQKHDRWGGARIGQL